MSEDINKVIKVLDEEGVWYRHYTEDRLIEMDLSNGSFQNVLQLITDNLEYWCYELCLSLDIKISFDFERISICY